MTCRRPVRTPAVALPVLLGLLLTPVALAASDGAEALRRTSSEGTVAVEAIFRAPAAVEGTEAPQELVFEVWLTTHSGDLSTLDLAARASVRTDRGEAAPGAVRWEVVRRSSRHPAGRLVVANRAAGGGPLLDAGTSFVELRLRNVGGVAERALRWELGPDYLVYVPNAASGTVSVIDPTKWEVVRTYRVGEMASHGVATSLDGRYLYTGNGPGGQVLVIDLASDQVVTTIPLGGNVHGLDITPDGRYVLAAGSVPATEGAGPGSSQTGAAGGEGAPDEEREGYVALIDTRAREPVARITGEIGGVVGHFDFSPDSRYAYLAVVSRDELVVLDLERKDITARVQVGDGPNEGRVSPDGREIYVANWLGNDVAVVDLERLQVVARIPSGEGPHGAAVSPDGSLLWVVNRKSNDVSIIDPQRRTLLRRLPAGEYANHVAFTPDGRWVLVSNMRDDSVVVYDLDGQEVARVAVGAEPHEFTFAPRR
ncbi:MAG: beta-propeller fold lactonase family protein [Firmicutes bacterium]|nr:beta-propeller fold lactonase family protein [Bacillota bacterium]